MLSYNLRSVMLERCNDDGWTPVAPYYVCTRAPYPLDPFATKTTTVPLPARATSGTYRYHEDVLLGPLGSPRQTPPAAPFEIVTAAG